MSKSLIHKMVLTGSCLVLGLFSYELAQASKTIRLGIPMELKHIDTYDIQYLEESETFAAIYDTLLEYQELTGFRVAAAERWRVDRAEGTITFHLKKNLKYSDGSPLSAQDAEFTLKRLIFLDKSNSFLLSRCLRDKNFRKLDQPHKLIQVLDDHTLKLGPTSCTETLLKEVADSNYGIVNKKYIDSKGRNLRSAPTSGAFTYKEIPGGLALKPNYHNWRWQDVDKSSMPEEIRFVTSKSITSKTFDPNEGLDAFRTASPQILSQAKAAGYQAAFSLTSMAWYLRPASLSGYSVQEWEEVMSTLNEKLDRSKIKAWSNNPIERPATTFFPKEMNCDRDKPAEKSARVLPPHALRNKRIRLIEHPSGESALFSQELKFAIESIGFKVDIVKKEMTRPAADTYDLFIERQFFDDSPLYVLSVVVFTFRTVPDPKDKISTKLKQIGEMEKSANTMSALKTVCDGFYHHFHVPLAHRQYAFLYKDPSLATLFSKGNASMLVNRLIDTREKAPR